MLRIKSVWSIRSQFITDHLKKKKKFLKASLGRGAGRGGGGEGLTPFGKNGP